MKKKLFSLALALALCLGLTVPAFAAELKIIEVPVPTVEEYEGKNYSTMEFHEGLSKLYVSEGSSTTAGFIDKTGKVVIPAKYSNAGDFSEGFAFVAKNGKLGFIDKTGKEVIPCEYDEVGSFDENGLAWVGKYTGGSVTVGIKEVKTVKWGLIDRTGKEVVACKYKDMESFSEGLAAVAVPSGSRNRYGYEGRKWGFVDTKGKEVIPCIYSGATDFSDGLSVVMRGDADAGEEEF